MTFTQERITNLLEFNSEGSDCQANAEQWEVHKLARIALASLEAEPVGYMNKFTGCVFTLEEQPGADTDAQVYVPVYTAPPAPVSMKDHQIRELVNELRDIAVEYHGTQQLRERIARTVRAAMLQGADQKDYRTIVERITEIVHGKVTDIDLLTVTVKSMKDILQKKADGNSPVIPDGWVLVPVEPTHEMLEAGDEQFGTYDVYRRMIAASPQQEVTQALAKGMERYVDAMQELAKKEVK